MSQQTLFAGLNKIQYEKIRNSLPSFMPDRDTCHIARSPKTGKLNYWVTTYTCPCMADKVRNTVQTRAYWKSDSTHDSIAAEMASKIEATHGQHYCPISTVGCTDSKREMVDDAIAIAQTFEKRNRELKAQVRVVVGSSYG